MNNATFTKLLYEAFSQPFSVLSYEYSRDFYRQVPDPVHGTFNVITPFTGIVNGKSTNNYEIRYTRWGDKGPIVLMLHGVPTNRSQYYELQKRLSPFCQTISIDMLGMGESSMPLDYGHEVRVIEGYEWVLDLIARGSQPWDWIFDTIYIEQIQKNYLKSRPIFFMADDWGGGILSHYAAMHSKSLLGAIWIDPIAFDGYPVAEIQAFGRASQLDDAQFKMAMGAADQTMVQIIKTMTYDPNVWNQYSLRNIKKTYFDVDYERGNVRDGEDATSLTMQPKMDALRVLTDRAAILAPALLLPFDPELNPRGVDYTRITAPCKIIWGKQDNMMPERQKWRFVYALRNAETSVESIDQAGHFVAVDQPDSVAESLMSFLTSKPEWRRDLGDIFLGLGGKHAIYKGDEVDVVFDLRYLYAL